MFSPSFDSLTDIPMSLFRRARASYWMSGNTLVANGVVKTNKEIRLIHSRDRHYGEAGYRPVILIGDETDTGRLLFLFFQDNTVVVGLAPLVNRPLTQLDVRAVLSPWIFGLTQDIRVTVDNARVRSEIMFSDQRTLVTPYGQMLPQTPDQENWLASLNAEGKAITRRMMEKRARDTRPAWMPVAATINETAIIQAWIESCAGTSMPTDGGLLSFESFYPEPKYGRLKKLQLQLPGENTLIPDNAQAHRFSQRLWQSHTLRGQKWKDTHSGKALRGETIRVTIPKMSAHDKIAIFQKQ